MSAGCKQRPSSSSTARAVSWLCVLLSFYRSRDGSPRSSEGQSPLYMHSSKCSSCGCQSPQHAEMCLHTPGSNFGEEMGETQSEYSDSSCGESGIPGRLFQPAGKGAVQPGGPSTQCPVSKWQSDLFLMLVDPKVLYSPLLTSRPAVCMHVRDTHTYGNCFLPPLPQHRPDSWCRELVTCCKLGS